jgi:hypothetical protein
MPLEVHEVSKLGVAVVKLNGQESGKAYTYGRRYSAVPLFGIPEHDDDCEGAMKREAPKQRKGYITLGEAQELKELYEEVLAAGKITAEEMKATLKSHKADKWTDLKDNRYEPLKKVLQGLL